ncbi:MAG: putative exported protein [Pseudomonas sp.]|nr:putative exported protein [Pseudomonas sp.]
MRTSDLVILLLAGLASQAQAETLRCGSQLISSGDREFEVQQKCGDPASRSLVGYLRSPNRREEVPIEEWIYGPSNGMYQYLRFEGGRLVQINSKRGS